MMKLSHHFVMAKAQRNGFFILILLILVVEFGFYFLSLNDKETTDLSVEEKTWLNSEPEFNTQFLKPLKIEYQNFNPNLYSKKDWQQLGFSEKQSEIILKYKYSLGGNFNSLNDIKNCFVINEAKFAEMEPYIQLAPVEIQSKNKKDQKKHIAKNVNLKPFNPNKLTLGEWMNLGFSQKQAEVILNYKNKILKGEFKTLAEVKDCYVINDKKFQELKPFIVLRKKKENNSEISKAFKNSHEVNVNQLTQQDWMDLGASQTQAENILKYKSFIGGFKTEEDVQKCEYISPEIIQQIKTKNINF